MRPEVRLERRMEAAKKRKAQAQAKAKAKHQDKITKKTNNKAGVLRRTVLDPKQREEQYQAHLAFKMQINTLEKLTVLQSKIQEDFYPPSPPALVPIEPRNEGDIDESPFELDVIDCF